MTQRTLALPTSIAPASGAVTITISSGAQEWLVQQISTTCDAAPVGATCRVYKDGAIVSKMLPAGDVASGDPPVRLLIGEQMTIVWTGLTTGAVCNATVIYDDGR